MFGHNTLIQIIFAKLFEVLGMRNLIFSSLKPDLEVATTLS